MDLGFIHERLNHMPILNLETLEKPNFMAFKHHQAAMSILYQHILDNSNIVVHCDVDMDGIGSGYIFKEFLKMYGYNKALFLINSEKEHGINDRHAEFINSRQGQQKVGLFVILDSASDNVEYISKCNCDVLVLDHHEMEHSTIAWENNGYKRLIINNRIPMTKDDLTEQLKNCDLAYNNEHMSAGLVVYEFVRVFCAMTNKLQALENKKLYQWATVTLYTDSIKLLNRRNLWYARHTICADDIEITLKQLLGILDKWNNELNKYFISYKLAPLVNKAIRAGGTGKALQIILDKPQNILELKDYEEEQARALELAGANEEHAGDYVYVDITNKPIKRGYTGVIASKISDNKHNVMVYTVNSDGIAEGSFRGRSAANYKNYVAEYKDGNYAKGHKAAFGFKVPVEDIVGILSGMKEIETEQSFKNYISFGTLPEEYRAEYHIDDFQQFKKDGGLHLIALANSLCSSDEKIELICSITDLHKLDKSREKIKFYNVYGMECKSFKDLDSPVICIYPELTSKYDIYATNYSILKK